MRDTEGANAASALRLAWGIDAPIGPPHRGLSRLTWRVGTIGWLARETTNRLAETRAEMRLLGILSTNTAFAVPTPIPTQQGQTVAQIGEHTWTLCQHVAGGRLGDEPASYGRLVTLLAVVHRTLCDVDSRHAVRPGSLVGRAREASYAAPDVLPSAAHAAGVWLRQRIAALDALPVQLIHGDFGIPNVLIDPAESGRCGVLDWELSVCDSPIFDLAQIAFGMVAFSRAAPSHEQVAALTRRYKEHGGQAFSEEQLLAALVAGPLANIMWLQERLTQGETALSESIRFLDERLGRLLQWLDQHG